MGSVSGWGGAGGTQSPWCPGCQPRCGLSELLIQAVLPFPVVQKDFQSLGTWPHTPVHTRGCGRAGAPKEFSTWPV